MEEHWRAGYHDTVRMLRHPEVLERPRNHAGLFIFDIDGDGREWPQTPSTTRRS